MALAAAALWPVAPAAGATFGVELQKATANTEFSCGSLYLTAGCTLEDPIHDDMELVLPDPVINGNQTGVVTAIHVASAGNARAQFVVVEWSGKPTEAKPFPSGVMAVSEQVELKPGINNFHTNLPVDRRLASNGFESWSVVALTILDGVSPLPVQFEGSYATTGLIADHYQPLTQTVADLTAPPHEVQVMGFPPASVLMSGEVTITTAKPEAKPEEKPVANKEEKPTVPALAQLTLPALARIVHNAAAVPIRCSGAVCTGTFRLQSMIAPGATAAKRAKKRKLITYASGLFSIPAGKSQTVKAKLTSAGKRAIKLHGSLQAFLNVTLAGGRKTSHKITLKS